MDFISSLLSVVHDYILVPATQHISYAMHVKSKMVKLRDEMSALEVIEADVERKVDAARARHQTPLNLVISWQAKVQTLKEEVRRVLAMESSSHVTSQCSPNFVSRYKLGKRAAQLLVVVKEYKEGNTFALGIVVDPNLPSPPEANFAALKDEVNVLTGLEADIMSLVDNAKRVRGLQPKHQVEGWLLTVANHKLDVNSIFDEFQQMKEADEFERNAWVNISVRMQRRLEKTEALISQERGFNHNVVDSSGL